MPRRAGKAASRRARQRAAQRGSRPSPPPSQPASLPRPQTEAVPPVGTPDAREAASLTPPRRETPVVTGDSRLGGRSRDEYHYVERDLRSIGLLTGLMAVLLLVAWAVFQALGLTT